MKVFELIKLLNEVEDQTKDISIQYLIYLQDEGLIIMEESEIFYDLKNDHQSVYLSSGLIEPSKTY